MPTAWSSRSALLLAAAVLVVVAGLGWFGRPSPSTPALPDPVHEPPDREAPPASSERPPASARRPPEPARSDLDREVIAHHPPLEDPAAWQQERARVALALQERQVAATRAFADHHHLEPAVTDELVAAIEALHVELRGLKQQVEAGESDPAALRQATPVLRSRCEDRVRAAIGPLTDELALHLADGEPGGGF